MLRSGKRDSFSEYLHYASSNKEEQTELYNAFSVNVTRFFRDNKPFNFLKNDVLPYLKRKSSGQIIKIWSADNL